MADFFVLFFAVFFVDSFLRNMGKIPLKPPEKTLFNAMLQLYTMTTEEISVITRFINITVLLVNSAPGAFEIEMQHCHF